jgi:cell division protein FtsA
LPGEIVVGLDVGTTKVCAIVGETGPGASLHITGVGVTPCDGLRKGVVVDLAAATRSIKESVQTAARQAQAEVRTVTAGISGEHLLSEICKGRVNVADPNGGITGADRDRALDQAKARFDDTDRYVLHVEPRFYAVDGQSGILKPVGMVGRTLEYEAHVATAGRSFTENLLKAIERAGLAVAEGGWVLNSIASAEAVLSDEERQLGVAVADIGGGVTDLSVYQRGKVRHSAVIPVGGYHVTHDLSLGLQVAEEEAERLKLEHGSALVDSIDEKEIIDIRRPGSPEPIPLPRRLLPQIIEPRMEELFELIAQKISEAGAGKPGAGIVLTGGGALLPGAQAVAERTFGETEIRLGWPRCAGGIADSLAKPPFSTAVGLAMIAARHSESGSEEPEEGLLHPMQSRLNRLFKAVFRGRGKS